MIIFFYGEDYFRSRQKLLEIKQKYLSSDKSGSGLSLFDWDNKMKVRDIIDVFSMPNLLAPKRLVVVQRLLEKSGEVEQKEMLSYLRDNKKSILEDTDLVILFWEEGKPKKTSLFKFLEESAKKQNFEKLSGIKLNQWIIKRVKELSEKTEISKLAIEKLIIYAGDNLINLDSEIQKLVSYQNGKLISEKDVELLVRTNVDANIFSTIDALASSNKKNSH